MIVGERRPLVEGCPNLRDLGGYEATDGRRVRWGLIFRSSNLGRLTNSLNIQPVETFVTLDYDRLVEIRVSRFEPDAAGNLVLECTWKLQPVSGRVASPRNFRTSIAVPVTRDPLGPQTELVTAMNEALALLAREVARGL